MRYMLDTDTVCCALRGQGRVAERLTEVQPSDVCMSIVTVAELRFVVQKRGSKKLGRLVEAVCREVETIAFDQRAAHQFGTVVADLVRRGAAIGSFDALIAAHARAMDLVLVTNDTKHFEKVPGLRVESWR